MEAKENSGQIGRHKYMYKVGNRVIIMGNEREWRRDCMLPIGVCFRKGRLLRVKRVAMEDIGHHLIRQRAGLSTWTRGRERTSRRSRPRNKCLAIPHGIGSPVLSFKTL